jgi:hypothetical protein
MICRAGKITNSGNSACRNHLFHHHFVPRNHNRYRPVRTIRFTLA